MPTGSTTLREQIAALPDALHDALKSAAKNRRRVDELEAKIDVQRELDGQASDEDGDGGDNDEGNVGGATDNDAARDELQFRIDRLKIDVDVAKSRAEVEYRSSVAKATDATAKAIVTSDEDVVRLRRELAEVEYTLRRTPCHGTYSGSGTYSGRRSGDAKRQRVQRD